METKNETQTKKSAKSINEKLQEARILLKKENIEKSGYNSFNKQKYFTLGDIEPPITRVCSQVRITPIVTYTNEVATLTIYDWDSEQTLIITSPMITQNDSKMNAIQNLGSIETYEKRYLLSNTFALVEENEEKTETTNYHDIMIIKQRIETLMTDLMKMGYDMGEVITKCGLKDEKQYMQYLNACGVIDKVEKNMRVLLNDKSKK